MSKVKQWQHEGYECVILKHDKFGHLCGYVGIPKEHRLYGKGDDDVYIDVHGGLTFAEHGKVLGWTTNDTWFFGFDCMHADDLVPKITKSGIYRDEAYVTEQCESLARQLLVQR